MTLEELITALDAADPTLVLPHGFTNPHSYRGYYDDLAFEPATNVLVADMLADARFALGTTYTGWKGGEFVMRGYTDCWLAQEGSAGGETLGPLLLHFMLAAGIRDAARTPAARQTTGQADTDRYDARLTAPMTAEAAAELRSRIESDTVARRAVGQPAEAQATDYDRDPEAIAWARRKIQDEIDRCRKFHASATEAGKPEQAEMWQRLANRMQRTFMGGSGCVIAYFDERLPAHRRATETEEARS